MSWIQNFFQKFKKDEEEEYNEVRIHPHYQETLPPQNQIDSLKDLDTRISYQYPKGGNLPARPPRVLQKDKQESVRPKRTAQLPEKQGRTEKPLVTPVKKEVTNKMKEQVSRSRGPFHPTEIPSPVFGFNRPKKSDTIVEHELSRFLQEDFENGVDHLIEADVETPASVTEILIETSSPALEEIFQAEETLLEEHVEQVEAVEESFPEPEPEFESEPEPETEPELEFESELEPEPEPEIVSDPEIPAQKRSKLPFNVMMLKQDKQKWEEKKRTREMEQKAAGEKEKKAVEIVNLLIKPLENNENESLNDSTYILPKSNLLNPPVTEVRDQGWLLEQEELLNQTLRNFNVGASVVNVTQGPSVTRFEVQPEPGVKVNKITNLSDDIKLSLAARDIRIEAPIPGKHTIGIEVPNHKSRPVLINEIIGSSVFSDSPSPLTAVLGLDIAGNPIVTDLKKMPHGLIAGATGSGKSVCINSILVSLIYKARPEDVKLLLIDPKMVELAPYNRIPHLVSPVITDVKAATAALKWAVDEMERRYELFAHTGVRDIGRFNELAIKHKRYSDKLPFIVIIIDELADLMMMSPADVEEAVCRIAQKARACGIHLILATQRPSVDVITGLIKANIPTRIAFSVSSQVDSRTIIDISGAEKLLGRGDMLFLENGSSKPVRLQGTYVSDEEIDLVVAHVREQREPEYLFEQEELLKKAQVTEEEDELFFEACEFIVDQGGASTSSLQRRFKIGYNRAARLMDLLEKNGYITGANGSKPRDVLITAADLEAISD
ncbi:DNA translocase FtsK [Bacillus sp. S3]|uniref:DNA translocase FtsK n=1 Tax=Bacillus sp. S3 TaxID=486398 RepID=UPI0016804614|nr:DNA translocase FtsK [Bacillus sp. S3]